MQSSAGSLQLSFGNRCEMQNSIKYILVGCLLYIWLPPKVCGQNNVEEAFSIYLDVGDEIENVISLVNAHETKLNDFDNKLLRIQNMLEQFEKKVLVLENDFLTAKDVEQKLQLFNINFEQRIATAETHLANSIKLQDDKLKQLNDNNAALQEELEILTSIKDDCCYARNNTATENSNVALSSVGATTTQSLAIVQPPENTTPASTAQTIRDCAALKMQLGTQYKDGVYALQLPGFDAFNVYCLTKCVQEHQVDCCPWTVILRNGNNGVGTMSNSCWEYEKGFGDAYNDYFVGLERLHKLTNLKRQTLLVGKTLQSTEFFTYDEFGISDEWRNYDVDALGVSWGHKIGAKFFLNSNKLKHVARNQCYLWPFKRLAHFNLFKRRFSNYYFMAVRPRICQ